jgi:hypothetical protein
MGFRKPFVIWGSLGVLLLSCLIGLGVFWFRPPVILVTDTAFERLYGLKRGWKSRLETSLYLFRRVKTTAIAENAGSDLIVFAVRETAENPYCVLFPYRYAQGAERYSRRFPSVPVGIFGGRKEDVPGFQGAPAAFPRVFWTDTPTDFYRAGRCAAVLSPEGEVLFLESPSVSAEDRDAFTAGLKDGNHGGARYISGASDPFPQEGVSAVVISGPAPYFFEQDVKAPVILFSWVDPAISPRNTVVVFDDSPWSLAAEGVRRLFREDVADSLPSKALVFQERIRERGLVRELRRAIALYPEKKIKY